MKRLRYRAYPTREQAKYPARTFGCAGVVFNDVLGTRETAREDGLPFPRTSDPSKTPITQAKLTIARAWLGEVTAVVFSSPWQTRTALPSLRGLVGET